MKYWILGCLLGLLVGCEPSERKRPYVAPDDPVFVKQSVNKTGLSFQNTLPAVDSLFISFPADSLQSENFLRLAERLLSAGGVAAGDLNNDGLPDLFFTAANGENQLYLNRGNWRFEQVTESAGLTGNRQWSAGVSFADVNADGWLDIYVSHFGPSARNELFIHTGQINEQGIPVYTEAAEAYGLTNEGQSVQSVFVDVDLDGDLDCIVLNTQLGSPDSSQTWPNAPDRLYQNNGGVFTDASARMGFPTQKFSTGVAIIDSNQDHWPDLVFSRDFPESDVLYVNTQKGTFQKSVWASHVPQRSLGIIAGDLDNDTRPDVFTASVLSDDLIRRRTQKKFGDNQSNPPTVSHNTLLHHEGSYFSEVAWMAGVAATDVSHGGLILDLDNDGWKDLFVPNGLSRDVRNLDFLDRYHAQPKGSTLSMKTVFAWMPSVPQSSFGFINQKNFRFASQGIHLGLGEPGFSNGAAYADLDNDGDLDLIVNQMGSNAALYRNDFDREKEYNSLKIKFKGPQQNPFGYGVEVRAHVGKTSQMLVLQPNQGYQSSQEPVLVLGLGQSVQADSLTIRWPGQKVQHLRNIPGNQTLVVDASESRIESVDTNTTPSSFLKEHTTELLPKDFPYPTPTLTDLNTQPFLPRTLAQEGPRIVSGDVNGDGLTDFFVTGQQTGGLYLQQPNGKFIPGVQPALTKLEHTVAALWVDIDGDTDLDLLTAPGNNQLSDSSKVHLFINDGKGNFTDSPDRIPAISMNASCIVAADIDKDGDLDIFIGGRSVPGSYGVTPRSYLLRNTNGILKDATPEVLSKIGMVTDASWQDLDKDGLPDLIVVGEWMPITIYYNRKGKFTYSHNQTIANSEGWWTTLKAADLDQDGDTDFVIGNWGLNSEYQASRQRPLYLQMNDFDRNGTMDAILTAAEPDGEQYPILTRSEWKTLLPNWALRQSSVTTFAEKPFSQLITSSLQRGTLEKKAVEFRSSMLINKGNGTFVLQPLPLEAQSSPVFAIAIYDFTKDGKPDILLGGNVWGMPHNRGRLDASRGTLLIAQKGLRFDVLRQPLFTGQIRDFAWIPYKNSLRLLVSRSQSRSVQAFVF